MGDATWADAAALVDALVSALWIALAVAVGVLVLAPIWTASRAVSRRLERHYLPGLARWSRRRAGLPEDAGPWACPACRSVNPPTVVACYACGGPRSGDAPELQEAAINPDIFHRPPPANEFDPSRYRGPGAPPPRLPAPGASSEPPSREVP